MSERLTREEAKEKIRAVAISGDAYHADEILDTLDALRARVERVERERDEAKEVFEVGLRSSAGWAKDLSAAYAERDALRAEAGRLREALENFVRDAEAAYLKRNTRVAADKTFEGEWVAVPLEDFRTLRERVGALAALDRTEERERHDE